MANGNWNDLSICRDGQVPDKSGVVVKSAVTVTADASCYSLKPEPGGTYPGESWCSFYHPALPPL